MVLIIVYYLKIIEQTLGILLGLTVDMRESSTETAKAVPQAKGCVRYSSVSGSSSSS